jgi:hypothetical protein
MSKVTVYQFTRFMPSPLLAHRYKRPHIAFMVAVGGAADMDGNAVSTRCVENDAKRKSSIPFCCGATRSPLSIKKDRPFRALIGAEIGIQ